MASDEPVLFWTTEPKFGCTQPVRSGDLVWVKETGHSGLVSIYEGLPFLVLGAVPVGSGYVRGLINGEMLNFPTAMLEAIVDLP